MLPTRGVRRLACLVAWLGVLPTGARAIDRPLVLAPSPAATVAPAPQLLTLAGDVPVRYSPGALDRAAHVQERLQALATDFRRWGGEVEGLHAVVLEPDDWAASGLARPFGLPDRADPRGVALPAWGNETSVALWRRLYGGGLPVGEETPMRGTAEEATGLGLADILGQVEFARLAVDRTAPRAEAWARELLAHVLAGAAFQVHEAERGTEIAALYARIAAHVAAAPPPADFHAGLEPQDWLATQPVFFQGAGVVLAKDGAGAAKRLLKSCRKGDGAELVSRLLERYIALGPWLRGAGAGR